MGHTKKNVAQNPPENAVAFQVQETKVDLESFRMLAEAIPNLAWIAHPDGSHFWYNQRWWEYTATVPTDMEGWGWTVVHDPLVLPKVIEKWQICLKDGTPFEMEFPLRGADGNFRWFLTRVMPVRDSANKIINWFGTGTDIHLQKLAIEKAALAEKRLSQLLASVPMILWATDKSGVVTLSEGRGLASIGLKPGETVGWDMMNSPEVPKESVQWIRRALSGESFDAITQFGEQLVETHYEPLLDENGSPEGMVAISNDITDKKKLEESLVQSEQTARDLATRLQAVLQNAPIALTEINSEGIYSFSDGRYLSNLGIKPGELVGQSCFDRHKSSPESLETLRRSFAGETVNSEVQNGDNWVWTMTTPLLVENGIVKSIVALSVDITGQRLAEKSIQTSELKFKKVCESKMFGMFFWDKTGAITDANNAFLEMIGYTRSELDSGLIDWKSITPPEYVKLDALAVNQTIAQGYCEPYEKEYFRKDGTRVAIIISGATIHDEAIEGGLALIIDISAKKKAEREKAESILNERAAVHASQTKSQFLANMSHEIRTPINGVLGMISLLLDTPLQAEQWEYANAARVSADSLLTVINDILDFSKIEAGKLEFENVDFDLFKVLHNVERAFLYQTEKKGLKLVFDCPQTLPRFYNGDSGRLRQILNNLLSNAIKFTTKGQITVKVRDELQSQAIRIEVSDTGMGIPANALDRMFKAFSQADSSTSRRFGGTGLGLSISKNLVEQMNGKIGVETRENIGSTFWFTVKLNRAKNPVKDLSGGIGSFEGMSARPMRVLIAEDNTINQKIALRYLEKMGLRADVVANGLEVLDALRAIPYDLILMDCQMPEMDGLEATRIIRSSESLQRQNIPIIAMTANAIKGDREKCLEAGMNDYVSKPVAPSELFLMLQKWLIGTNKIQNKDFVEYAQVQSSPLVDLSVIDELRKLGDIDDDTLLNELVSLYLTSVPISISKMVDALQSERFDVIASEAHQMKSASANLGAQRMAELAAGIETAAFTKQGVGPLLKAFETAYHLTRNLLEDLSARPGRVA